MVLTLQSLFWGPLPLRPSRVSRHVSHFRTDLPDMAQVVVVNPRRRLHGRVCTVVYVGRAYDNAKLRPTTDKISVMFHLRSMTLLGWGSERALLVIQSNTMEGFVDVCVCVFRAEVIPTSVGLNKNRLQGLRSPQLETRISPRSDSNPGSKQSPTRIQIKHRYKGVWSA